MIQRITILLLLEMLILHGSFAQKHYQRYHEIDIQHYKFELKLNDDSNEISGKAIIDIRFLKSLKSFQLDLVGKKEDSKKGMIVKKVLLDKMELEFDHTDNKLNIILKESTISGAEHAFTILYSGEPIDGLIIAKNKHGDRTFFGDNWPDRAQHWLPTVDHPSDKATVEFIVTAPDHYQVIANGTQIEETNIDDETKLTHWKEAVPLPTKVMVIGVARFAVNAAGYINHIPVTTWVYRQDRDDGFSDYKIAVDVLDYFYNKIGSYPYEKLANVQSKTRYGGMENAGNIFYYENSVNGKQDQEKLIAHEIAHQWFGNSASELNWHHIWLSEGFATYLTDLYLEDIRGREVFIENLKTERKRVINYYKKNAAPIVNVKINDYNELLNPNSYQKGAWVLHMLRKKVGDELFWEGIKSYYEKYKFSNALSEDFQKVMEEVSGKKLDSFFKQWLYQAGHPILEIDVSKKASRITIQQVQKDGLFNFPLDLDIIDKKGNKIRKTIIVDSSMKESDISINGKIKEVIIDPDCCLLFEEK